MYNIKMYEVEAHFKKIKSFLKVKQFVKIWNFNQTDKQLSILHFIFINKFLVSQITKNIIKSTIKNIIKSCTLMLNLYTIKYIF